MWFLTEKKKVGRYLFEMLAPLKCVKCEGRSYPLRSNELTGRPKKKWWSQFLWSLLNYRWWQLKYFLMFIPIWGNMIQFDGCAFFSDGLGFTNHQLLNYWDPKPFNPKPGSRIHGEIFSDEAVTELSWFLFGWSTFKGCPPPKRVHQQK